MRFLGKKWAVVSVVIAQAAIISVASAQTLRIGNQGDALSLDPHSLNEALQLSVLANAYEGLIGRGKNLEISSVPTFFTREAAV